MQVLLYLPRRKFSLSGVNFLLVGAPLGLADPQNAQTGNKFKKQEKNFPPRFFPKWNKNKIFIIVLGPTSDAKI
jgi:hypothetical protein